MHHIFCANRADFKHRKLPLRRAQLGNLLKPVDDVIANKVQIHSIRPEGGVAAIRPEIVSWLTSAWTWASSLEI